MYDDDFDVFFVVGIIAFLIVVFTFYVVVLATSDYDVASEVNPLCVEHTGVARVESDYVICRDGKVVNR
jgi:hypothetical protein